MEAKMRNDDREVAPRGKIGQGRVSVQAHCAASLPEAWAAISDPPEFAQWFGDLARPLRVGEQNRIEFGDGDFFDLMPRRVEPPELVFEWSFLGVGRRDLITWQLTRTNSGVTVEVHDCNSSRSSAEADEMLSGWTDFLTRLQLHLRTGEKTRYAWRDDIDGSVELAADDFHPLREPELYEWLPIASDGFAPSWFFVLDGEGPRRFPILDWVLEPDQQLRFAIDLSAERHHPACTVQVRDLGNGIRRLSFSHTGWNRLGWSEQRSQSMRRRFAASWIAALESARSRTR
ncbi:SRPBCC domain-containing protein [Saccharopolyspora cebuensis]|uniref:SRPBCC domain-containing protein n=1 Tax=Saccharopolyspora cebuensis TaxID=418759 RepID=A0ABV4CSH4_9PSEU